MRKLKFINKFSYLINDIPDLPRKIVFSFHRRLDNKIYGWNYSHFGKRTIVYKPIRIIGARNISIGEKVTINKGAYLYALKIMDCPPKLVIGKGSTIGFFSHIVAVGEVNIGEKVLIADKVYIGDNMHCYDDIKIPIMDQGVKYTGSVNIGDGTWIGDNVSIVSCNIGRHCIIGANSFVNSDIPDYSMACGNPARIIKRYNESTRRWERVNNYE